jgi:hypothetical protein
MTTENGVQEGEKKEYKMTFWELARLLRARALGNIYIALVIFLLLGLVFLWLSYVLRDSVPAYIEYALRSVGGAFFAAAFITIVARIFVIRHYVIFENKLQEFVRTGIETSLDDLKQSVRSSVEWVKHLNESNVSNVYANRRQATLDMQTDITKRGTRTIQIAGISLNDFVRANSSLHAVWTTIIRYINRKMPPVKKDLAIRVLVVHPDCLGAELRSLAEHRRGATIAGRLRKDVNITAELLAGLEDKSRKINTGRREDEPKITFEARVYSLTPMFFMFRTDTASYVQQYYFWSSREVEQYAPAPLIRYSAGEKGDINNVHEQMRDHFDWIWMTASVPVAAYLREYYTGHDKGLVRASCLNVYNSTSACKGRILSLLKNAKGNIDILGISLKSFFNEPFFNALRQAVNRSYIKSVRILIVDRHCEQAKYRSYREYLLGQNRQQLTFDEYKQSDRHKDSELCRDTEASLLKIKNHFTNTSKVNVRLYHCAPTCFVLGTGDSVLVEQYHYGKAIGGDQSEEQRVLGKDMPVYEYTQAAIIELDAETQRPFPPENNDEAVDLEGRAPFQLVNNHIDHIWNHYSRSFDPDKDIGSHPSAQVVAAS